MAAAGTRIRWDRLGRWALLCVLGLVVYLYLGPTLTWIATHSEAKQKRGEVAVLRAQNVQLRARRAELRSSYALEREARRLGMVKAGERAYVIQGLSRRR